MRSGGLSLIRYRVRVHGARSVADLGGGERAPRDSEPTTARGDSVVGALLRGVEAMVLWIVAFVVCFVVFWL